MQRKVGKVCDELMIISTKDETFKRVFFYFISLESLSSKGQTLLEFLMREDTQSWRLWDYFTVVVFSLDDIAI